MSIRIGHIGIVRLTGDDLKALRAECFARDKGQCQECGNLLYYYPRYDGDPEAYDMAHIQSRGSGGSDIISNIRSLCHRCHMKAHTEGESR